MAARRVYPEFGMELTPGSLDALRKRFEVRRVTVLDSRRADSPSTARTPLAISFASSIDVASRKRMFPSSNDTHN